MKERIIVAGGISEVELLRTLSRNGVNTFALRVMSPVDLCEYALIKAGCDMPKRLNYLDCTGIILSILKRGDNSYFASSTSFRDAGRVFSSLNLLRGLVIDGDEEDGLRRGLENGTFPSKNNAIIKLYKDYIHAVKNLGLDDISLMRRTLDYGAGLDAELIILEEYKLSPLEEKVVSAVGENVKKVSILSFYKESDCKCSKGFIKAYGEGNEVETVISTIYRNNLPLDECIVASANTELQSLLFYDISKLYDIPLTFSTGLPVSLSAPASLLSALIEWNTFGYNGKDAWKALLENDGFNGAKFKTDIALGDMRSKVFIDMVGSLRLSFASDNAVKVQEYEKSLHERLKVTSKERSEVEEKIALLEPVRKLVSILSGGFIDFFDHYSVIRKGEEEFDGEAKKRIIETLRSYYECSGHKEDYENIKEDVLSIRVNRKTSSEGALHFTSIKGAMSSMRKNVFITGLSSAEFPGAPIQDYLALDDDILSLSASIAATSTGRIEERISSLNALEKLTEKTAERVYYSYSSYDTAELKERNPSSWLYSRMGEEKERGYFSSGITPSFSSGVRYINGEGNTRSCLSLKKDIRKDGMITTEDGDIRRYGWSPSSMEVFLTGCPRHFYLASVIGIPDDSPDNPLETMKANDFGTLVHHCIENFSFDGLRPLSKEEFVSLSSIAFDNAIKERPPVNYGDIKYKKREFLETIEKAYDLNAADSKPLSSEEELRGKIDDDFFVSGYPDRITMNGEKKLTVIDFKTGMKNSHKVKGSARGVNKNPYVNNDDKFRYCFQVLLYAWLFNQDREEDEKVEKCEYRYPRLDGEDAIASVDFNDGRFDLDSYMEDKLRIVKEALEENDASYFPRNENSCTYCNLKAYCRWPGDGEDVEEDEDNE